MQKTKIPEPTSRALDAGLRSTIVELRHVREDIRKYGKQNLKWESILRAREAELMGMLQRELDRVREQITPGTPAYNWLSVKERRALAFLEAALTQIIAS